MSPQRQPIAQQLPDSVDPQRSANTPRGPSPIVRAADTAPGRQRPSDKDILYIMTASVGFAATCFELMH
jgi:hypothetical protein